MRVMCLLRASSETESDKLPTQELLTAMTNFNEELVKAGVLLAAEGLRPSKKGARVTLAGPKRSVIDGPFTETKELISGFWILQVSTMDEAIEWIKRCPMPYDGEAVIEIRQISEPEDFGEAFTADLQAREQALGAQMAENRGA
jgi:hypothetical protein